MKIHEYNEMMAYLTRPAPTRQPAVQGGVIGKGGMFQGEDIGYRTGFGKLVKDMTPEERARKNKMQRARYRNQAFKRILTPYKIFGKEVYLPQGFTMSGNISQNKKSIEDGFKKLKKWAEDPTSKNWTKVFGRDTIKDNKGNIISRQKGSAFGYQLRNYLAGDDIVRGAVKGNEQAKEIFDAINLKKLLKDAKINPNKILELDTALLSDRARTFGAIKYTIPEQIAVIKDFGDGEKWLASKKRTDSEIRKYANVVRSIRREAETIGGFPFGDNDAKKLWSNLYRASYRGDRIKIKGEFANGELPIDNKGKLNWSLKNKDKIPAWKRVQYIDTEANNAIFKWDDAQKRGGLQNQIDDVFGEGFFDQSTKAYKDQRSFAKTKGYDDLRKQVIKFEAYLKDGTILDNEALSKKIKRFNLTEVHHPDGVGANPYKTEAAFRFANREMAKIERGLETGTLTPDEAKIKINNINRNVGPIRTKLDDGYYGSKSGATQKSIRSSAIKYINSLLQGASKPQIMKIRKLLGCPEIKSSGGRVGFAPGGNLLSCPMTKLAQNPEAVLNKVGQAMPETRSPILDVLKKAGAPLAKWGGRAFVAAGPAFVMMETMDAAEKFREGEPAGQIAADAVSNLLLPGVGASYELAQKRKMMKDIASSSELAAMEKEDKLRYAKMLQEDPLRETDYGSMIEENISTPAEQLDRFNLEEKTTTAYDYNKEQRKEQRQEVQDQFFKNIREKADDYLGGSYTDTNEISLDDIVKSYYNEGGRVGFAKGPKDPSKRLFIKGLAALSVLPIVGKYFKLAKSPTAVKAVETAMEKVSGMPDWFQPFVNKVLKEGKDVTKTEAIADRQIVKRVDIEDATVDVHYDVATNDVRVEVVGGKTAFDEPLQMEYKAPEMLETGGKSKAEFSAAESRPVQTSPDDIELDGYDTDVLDDLLSETDYLEGYATGKIRTPAEIKKAKLRAKMREDAQRDPGSLLDDFDD